MNADNNLHTSTQSIMIIIIPDAYEAKNGPDVESGKDHEVEEPATSHQIAIGANKNILEYIHKFGNCILYVNCTKKLYSEIMNAA